MRIAQISDLHLTPDGSLLYGSVNTWAAFASVLLRLATLEPRPDFLMVTGDLAEGGDAATYRRLADRLGEVGIPFAVIPGNHDDRRQLRTAFSFPGRVGACHQRIDLGEASLLLLDSLVPGKEWGQITPAHVNWLDSVTTERRPSLLALHHPPFAVGIPGMDRLRCRGEGLLADWLSRHPEVAAVLCGHVHRFVATTFAGRPAATAPSPAHQIALSDGPLGWTAEPGGFLLHLWQPGERPLSHYLPSIAAPVIPYRD